MELIKVLRLRVVDSTIEERLKNSTNSSGYKGGFSDVRVEIYVETKTEEVDGKVETWDDYELKFIKLFKVTATNTAPEPDVSKKYSNRFNKYGNTRSEVLEFIIPDFISRNAYNELIGLKESTSSASLKCQNYYQIIQDPWQDEPPLQRNYGKDPYFLNNKSKLQIYWRLPSAQSVSFYSKEYAAGLTSSTNYSSEDGGENFNKFLNETDLKFAKDEKKKISKTIMAYDTSDGNKLFVLSSNDIKAYGTASEPDTFPGDTQDLDIINKFIEIWKKKVPNYDLKLNVPNYAPSGATLSFIDPTKTNSAGETQVDNKSQEQTTADEVKFKLSIVFDKNITIKAGQDMPDVNIYVGDPPVEGEFLFDEDEFDDLYLLDDEYKEAEFAGEGENLLEFEEIKEIEKQVEEQKKADPEGSQQVNISVNGTVKEVVKSTPGYGGAIGNEFNGVPYYCQGDARWGSIPYGNKATGQICREDNGNPSTNKSSACGPTSLSMVINYWAKKGYCSATTPADVADIFSKGGGRVCGSGTALMAGGAVKKIKEVFDLVMVSVTEEKLLKAIKKGYPGVISARGYGKGTKKAPLGQYFTVSGAKGNRLAGAGGHFVCLTGVDPEGRVRVNDPGYAPSGGVAAFPANTKPSQNVNTFGQCVMVYPAKLGSPV
jgi:hypothetical protein